MFSLSSPLLSFSLLLLLPLLPLLTRRLAAEVEGGPSLPPPPLPACAIVVVVIEPKSQAEETKGKKALFVNFSVYLLISKKKIVIRRDFFYVCAFVRLGFCKSMKKGALSLAVDDVG